MTVLYFDGFGTLAGEALSKQNWLSTGSVFAQSPSGGRRNGAYATQFAANYNNYRNLGANHSTLIMGVAFYHAVRPVGTMGLFGFSDGAPAAGTAQIYVRLNAAGTLSIYRGTTLLATTTYVLPLSTYTFLELKVVFHASAGSYELKAGTVSILSASGIDTTETANAYANHFFIGQPTGTGDSTTTGIQGGWDDLYVCNDAGSVSNTFLGDVRVDVILPNAAGTYTQFTPSTGSNWQNVDETANPSTDYNHSATVGHKDTYNFPDLPSLPYNEVLGVKTNIIVNTDVDGSRELAPLMVSGSTETEGTQVALTTATKHLSEFFVNNPDTAAAWTQAQVNAVQVGAVIKV